jgi:hypothetical protein
VPGVLSFTVCKQKNRKYKYFIYTN